MNEKLIQAVRGIRDRATLKAVIDAAEARDSHLSRKESMREWLCDSQSKTTS